MHVGRRNRALLQKARSGNAKDRRWSQLHELCVDGLVQEPIEGFAPETDTDVLIGDGRPFFLFSPDSDNHWGSCLEFGVPALFPPVRVPPDSVVTFGDALFSAFAGFFGVFGHGFFRCDFWWSLGLS